MIDKLTQYAEKAAEAHIEHLPLFDSILRIWVPDLHTK